MKKIFLSELKIENSVYVYEDYELKGDQFFFEDEKNAIFYEGFAPVKVIPLSKDLPIKELFMKGQVYGENQDGEIERIDHDSDIEAKKLKNKASYIVASKAVRSSLEDPIKAVFSDQKVTQEYSLGLFGRTLYTELANLTISSFQDIVNFCKTWGLPTGATFSDLENKKPGNNLNIIWMSLEDFYTKIEEYHRVYSYFKALNTKDFSNLPTFPKKVEALDEHASRMLNSELKEKSIFSFRINKETPFSVFTDLFEAAYFYLALSIQSNAKMRSCEFCGHLFEATHQRQRFCSVLPGRKRSSCEMAYNNRLKKEKKQKGEI